MYLCFVAMCLFFKSYLDWYRAWLYIRKTLDAAAIARIMAAIMAGNGTPEDAGKVHIAQPPKSIAQTTRDAIVRQRAADMSPALKNLVSPLDPESVGGAK